MSANVEFRGLDRLQIKMAALLNREHMHGAMLAAGKHLQSKIAVYPKGVSYPIAWASPAQRAAYFAKRRAANLPLKYTRSSDPMSETLGKSWNTAVAGNAMSATVGTPATYAPFVQDEGQQQPFHKATGWVTVQDVAREESGEVARIVMDAVRDVLLRM